MALTRYKHLLSGFIITLSALLLASCASREERDFESLREFATQAAEADSSAFTRQWIAAIDTLQLAKQSDRKALENALAQFAYHGLSSGQYVQTVKFLRGIIDRLESTDNLTSETESVLLRAYVCIGAALEESGMASIGMDYYEKGLERIQKPEHDHFRAMIYNNIAVLYIKLKEFDKGLTYFNKALAINKKLNQAKEISLNYANLADVHYRKGNLDQALDLSLKALLYLRPEEDPHDFYMLQVFQAQIYNDQGKYDLAMSYLNSSLHNLKRIKFVIGEIECYEQLSRTYLSRNMPDSTDYYAKLAINRASEAGLLSYIEPSLKVLYTMRKEQGQYGEAIRMLERATEFGDSLRSEESRLRLNERASLAPVVIPAPNYGRIILYWLLGTVVVVALAFTIFFYTIRRRYKRKLAQDQQMEFDSTKEELSLRNREITALELDRVRTHENIASICGDLKELLLELNPKATAQKRKIKLLLNALASLGDNMENSFMKSFGRVNPKFYDALRKRCSSLTPREERLSALLYLGLTTKEIASITSREVRSVESSRNRLRKKLEIDASEDLTSFLKSLSL